MYFPCDFCLATIIIGHTVTPIFLLLCLPLHLSTTGAQKVQHFRIFHLSINEQQQNVFVRQSQGNEKVLLGILSDYSFSIHCCFFYVYLSLSPFLSLLSLSSLPLPSSLSHPFPLPPLFSLFSLAFPFYSGIQQTTCQH